MAALWRYSVVLLLVCVLGATAAPLRAMTGWVFPGDMTGVALRPKSDWAGKYCYPGVEQCRSNPNIWGFSCPTYASRLGFFNPEIKTVTVQQDAFQISTNSVAMNHTDCSFYTYQQDDRAWPAHNLNNCYACPPHAPARDCSYLILPPYNDETDTPTRSFAIRNALDQSTPAMFAFGNNMAGTHVGQIRAFQNPVNQHYLKLASGTSGTTYTYPNTITMPAASGCSCGGNCGADYLMHIIVMDFDAQLGDRAATAPKNFAFIKNARNMHDMVMLRDGGVIILTETRYIHLGPTGAEVTCGIIPGIEAITGGAQHRTLATVVYFAVTAYCNFIPGYCPGARDIGWMRFDWSGTGWSETWRKAFGMNLDDLPSKVISTGEGELYITSAVRGDSDGNGADGGANEDRGGQDYLILACDETSGDVLWKYQFGTAFDETVNPLSDIIHYYDGHIAMNWKGDFLSWFNYPKMSWDELLSLPICPPGYYIDQDTNMHDCVVVPVGHYNVSPNLKKVCPPGTYQDKEGQPECIVCAIGTVQPLEGQTSCVPCDPGKATALKGSTLCSACADGTYNDGTSLGCIPCPEATYMDEKGASACKACPEYTTSFLGSPDVTMCVCEDGAFGEPANGKPCKGCPPNATCKSGATIPVYGEETYGYSEEPEKAYKCLPPYACPGENSDACNNGYEGKVCRKCSDGYSRYPDTSCQTCSASAAATSALLFVVARLTIPLLFVVGMLLPLLRVKIWISREYIHCVSVLIKLVWVSYMLFCIPTDNLGFLFNATRWVAFSLVSHNMMCLENNTINHSIYLFEWAASVVFLIVVVAANYSLRATKAKNQVVVSEAFATAKDDSDLEKEMYITTAKEMEGKPETPVDTKGYGTLKQRLWDYTYSWTLVLLPFTMSYCFYLSVEPWACHYQRYTEYQLMRQPDISCFVSLEWAVAASVTSPVAVVYILSMIFAILGYPASLIIRRIYMYKRFMKKLSKWTPFDGPPSVARWGLYIVMPLLRITSFDLVLLAFSNTFALVVIVYLVGLVNWEERKDKILYGQYKVEIVLGFILTSVAVEVYSSRMTDITQVFSILLQLIYFTCLVLVVVVKLYAVINGLFPRVDLGNAIAKVKKTIVPKRKTSDAKGFLDDEPTKELSPFEAEIHISEGKAVVTTEADPKTQGEDNEKRRKETTSRLKKEKKEHGKIEKERREMERKEKERKERDKKERERELQKDIDLRPEVDKRTGFTYWNEGYKPDENTILNSMLDDIVRDTDVVQEGGRRSSRVTAEVKGVKTYHAVL